MQRIARLLLILLFLPGPLWAACENWLLIQPPVPPDQLSQANLSGHFENLAHQGLLLRQLSPSLNEHSLLVADGGLCGPICGINILHSVMSFKKKDAKNFPEKTSYLIARIAEYHRNRTHLDARYGMDMISLRMALNFIALSDLKLQLGMRNELLLKNYPFTIESLVPRPNELIIAAIESGLINGKKTRHAIVILEANPATGVVIYADPNDVPMKVQTTASKANFRDAETIRVGYQNPRIARDQETGVVTELLHIEIYR